MRSETDRETHGETSPSITNLQRIFNSSHLLHYFSFVVKVVWAMFLYPCLFISLATEQNFAHGRKDSAGPFCNVYPIHYGIKIAEPPAKLKPMTLNAEY